MLYEIRARRQMTSGLGTPSGSREKIVVIACALANALGVDIDKLPLASAALEWYSEKAVAIAFHVIASGSYAVLGVMRRPSVEAPK